MDRIEFDKTLEEIGAFNPRTEFEKGVGKIVHRFFDLDISLNKLGRAQIKVKKIIPEMKSK